VAFTFSAKRLGIKATTTLRTEAASKACLAKPQNQKETKSAKTKSF